MKSALAPQPVCAPPPVMSYREAYEAGLPVAVPSSGELTIRDRPFAHSPAPLRWAALIAWGVIRLGAACAVLLLLVLIVVRTLGVLA